MSNKSVLVSVLMTAYNREKNIAEAIQSVLDSTYRNFELIIVDDCSTDKTVEIAKAFELNDSRIKVYLNTKNLLSDNRFSRKKYKILGSRIDKNWIPNKIVYMFRNSGNIFNRA